MTIIGTRHETPLTCGEQHLPGCHNTWLDTTWCICGAFTWPGDRGVWKCRPIHDHDRIGQGPTLTGWDHYFMHALPCDPGGACAAGCVCACHDTAPPDVVDDELPYATSEACS